MRISTITTTTNSDYAAKSIKAVSQTSQQHAQTASGVITPPVLQALEAVSYTHLTLPTNREV